MRATLTAKIERECDWCREPIYKGDAYIGDSTWEKPHILLCCHTDCYSNWVFNGKKPLAEAEYDQKLRCSGVNQEV